MLDVEWRMSGDGPLTPALTPDPSPIRWARGTGGSEWCNLRPQLVLSGNATETQVTLFLDSRRTSSSQDLAAYWDDVAAYRAYVPAAPRVSGWGSTSLAVKVAPDCNADTPDSEFAISIGGGAYTLGTNWVQANGSVGRAVVWQSASAWGTRTVPGLVTGVPCTFAVQARYSSTYTQPTSLGASAIRAPVATPPPQLRLQRNGNTLTLTWPVSPGAQLQQATSLTGPGNWATATNEVTIVGDQKSVTLPDGQGAGFYRLAWE